MMSWQAWKPPVGWPACAPSVRWQTLPLSEADQATLWLFELDALAADSPPLTACLSHAERERAHRFKLPHHGRRHRVARSMVRHILAHLLHQPAAALAWPVGVHGKPGPQGNPPRLHFNLSHSNGWALLATSFTLELGVDLEDEAASERIGELAERILSPSDRLAFRAQGKGQGEDKGESLSQALLNTWVRKEACLKAVGTGLTQEMSALTLRSHLAHIPLEAPGPTARPALSRIGQADMAMEPTHTLNWCDVTLPPDCAMLAALAWLRGPSAHATQG